MKSLVGFIKLDTDDKSKVVLSNIRYSVGIKVVSVVITFLTVPLLINYLDSTLYGVWLTMVTFTSWFTLFDLGLGNGLKNKLTEFLAKENMDIARQYISTTYISMTIICLFIGILIYFLSPLVPWNKIFNIKSSVTNSVRSAVTVILIFTLINMVLRLINQVLYAHQYSYKVDLINAMVNLVTFLSLYLVKVLAAPSLLIVASIYSLSQFFALIIANIFLFLKKFKTLTPSFGFYDFKLTKQVVNLGGQFFFIQLAGLVMYMSDNFVITWLFGPDKVTVYNIAFKFYSLLLMGWVLILTPLWAMITKAYYSNDLSWIKRVLRRLVHFWFITIFGALIMLIFSNMIYKLWIGREIVVPFSVNLSVMLYVCVSIFTTLMATFINGIGKIRLQVYITSFLAIINIPLAIVLAKKFQFGLIGIPLSTLFCLAISSFFAYVQCKKILLNKALGLWNK